MTRVLCTAALVLGAGSFAPAGELGDKAPALQIKEWVKGAAVDLASGDGKKAYVVEFWATWCPPCRASIPHLTEMQKKFKDKVTFIGVSDEPAPTVRKFVERMGDKMDYAVAVDDNRQTSARYMGAFGIGGIPHAFVVDASGAIVWHGHPMSELEQVLERVVAGELDLAALRRQQEDWKRLQGHLKEYQQLVSATGNESQARQVGERIVELGADNSELMDQFAWQILTNPKIVFRDKGLALKAAQSANQASDGANPSVLDTYALALYENGQRDKAIEFSEKAITLAKNDPAMQRALPDFKQRLERFKKGE
jgi:thiol-disulfide isomerase/thioredoxin